MRFVAFELFFGAIDGRKSGLVQFVGFELVQQVERDTYEIVGL